MLEHGTGALNVDGTRIETEDDLNGGTYTGTPTPETSEGWRMANTRREFVQPSGCWPANVILDEEAAQLLDEQSGERPGGGRVGGGYGRTAMFNPGEVQPFAGFGDTGGASRLFYTAKASRKERNAGLEDFEPRFAPTMGGGIGGREHSPDDARSFAQNDHPTVKPIALMRWLVRLVTPPGGLVADPFNGSGTTGIACLLEGFDYVGINLDPHYIEISAARIAHYEKEMELAS